MKSVFHGKKMKIAIIGAGGVGGYFGARLADAGHRVHFIARGEHLQKIKTVGLKVFSPLGDLHLKNLNCSEEPIKIGNVDIVLITVKLWATEEAVSILKPLLGTNTAVISLQNGVVAVDTLIKTIDKRHVLGGVSKIAALIEEPGIIRHNGNMAALVFGELNGGNSDRTAAFLQACQSANISAEVSSDIHTAIWEKFVLLVTMSSITALTRLPIGPNREDPDVRQLMEEIMREVIEVGSRKGARFPQDILQNQFQHITKLPPEMVASMCGDLRRHNKLELPWFAGSVVKMGKELGIPTPANKFIFASLKLHKDGRHPMLQI